MLSKRWALALLTLVSACGGRMLNEQSCDNGSETCACFGNDTCNDGLACRSGQCVPADESGFGDGGSPGTGGTGEPVPGTAGRGGTPATGGTGEPGGTGGRPSNPRRGACTQTDELEELAQAEYDGLTPGEWGDYCGRTCLPEVGTELYAPCITQCVMDKTQNAITPECARCFAIPMECSIDHCFGECAADTPECDPCICAKPEPLSCIEMYTECSGLPSDVCMGL